MWSLSKSKTKNSQIAAIVPAAAPTPGPDIVSIWARQIDNARQQTETAITDLTVRFGDIVQRMDAGIAASQGESDRHAGDAEQDGKNAETHLASVVEALRGMQASRDLLAAEVAAIVAYTGELRRMAEDVKQIAFQTNMLSLNAAIEAAHAGESGKGFAVVAHEVQLLSKASRETGQRIDERIGAITGALAKIDAHNRSLSGLDAEAIRRSEANIRAVLERQQQRTTELHRASGQVRAENNAIKADVEDALVNLQFQDRVSQILAQVVQMMQQFTAPANATDTPAGVVDFDSRRLEQMARSYTTEEQRRIHAGLDAEAVAPREATFF